MKQKKTTVVALCLIFTMAINCFAPMMETSAREETKTITDTFDSGEDVGAFNADEWTGYGTEGAIKVEELAKPQKVIKGEARNITGETNLLMSKDWYWEIHSFSFDMYMPADTTWDNSKWVFLDFVDIEDPIEYAGDYSDEYGKPMCYDGMKALAADDFGLMRTTWKDWGFESDTIGDVWMSIKVVTDSATTGKIMIAPKGQAFDESKAQGLTLAGNKSFYNSNIVLGDFKFAGYMFDNFVIETDTGTFKEDFEDGTNDLFEEISIRPQDEPSYPIIEYGGSRQLAFENAVAEDCIIANTEILQEDEHLKATDKVLDVSFKVDYKNNNTSEEIAYVFGLASNDSSPFADNYAVVVGKNSVRLSYFDAEGEETICASKKLGAALKGSTITLSLTKNGVFTAQIGGTQVLKYSGIENYEGYAGFAAKTDVSKAIYLDDVVMNNCYFDVITTKSWADDFSEDKMGSGTDSDYAWFVEGGSMQVANGELVFNGCSDNTYFGPAYEYETYELSFQMTSIMTTDDENKVRDATYHDRWIGFDFGKKNSSIKSYGTYGMFAVKVTSPYEGEEWTEAGQFVYRLDSSVLEEPIVKRTKNIPKSYFENIAYDGETKVREDISPDDAVCFKLVALENKLELYMKRAADKEYIHYTTVENVDPKGYIALACTGFAFWTIDNFEIKNTAEFYNEAPPIVLQEKVFPTLEERGVGVEDTYWAKEQKLNAEKESGFPIGLTAGIAAAVIVAGTAVVIIVQAQKKKKTKDIEAN